MPDFQNPQQEPGSEKRLLLVFVLTFVALFVFQPLLKKFAPPPPPPEKQTVPAQTAAVPATPAPSAAPAVAQAPTAAKQASSETETVIENDLYRITFTNRGAQVKSWILKRFDNDAQNGPLELVHFAAAQKYGYPLSLWTYDETLRNRLSSGLYLASSEGQLAAPASLTFEYADQDLSVHKTFHFDHTYVLTVETSVTYKGSDLTALPAWPAGFGDQATPASYAAGRIDYHDDASTDRTALVFPNFVLRLPFKSISSGNTLKGPLEWAGPVDQYFAAIFIPEDPGAASMVTLRNALAVSKDPQKPESKETANFDVLGAAVG
ncbi:MAG: membrane protein insertase YidC, partial [Candidatus Sulfotelmatobacter sp.]